MVGYKWKTFGTVTYSHKNKDREDLGFWFQIDEIHLAIIIKSVSNIWNTFAATPTNGVVGSSSPISSLIFSDRIAFLRVLRCNNVLIFIFFFRKWLFWLLKYHYLTIMPCNIIYRDEICVFFTGTKHGNL